jgi:hypothetical protein
MQLAVVLRRDGDAALVIEGYVFGVGVEGFLAVGKGFLFLFGFCLVLKKVDTETVLPL